MSDIRAILGEETPRLRRYAVALTRDANEADDLVEDTLREAIARGFESRDEMALRVWLLTILHEQRDNPFRLPDPTATLRRPQLNPAAEATLSRFDRALGRLPEGERAAILLIGLEGMTHDATAEILAISATAMRTRLLRARESLARQMAAPTEAPARRPQRARRVSRAA
ncbi:MAG TPA: RNA polymerase sigma factor [Stellaceae bacterium]|jgi:RNA polymerase sigma-70 factor (ECF subfamily)